MTKTIFFLIDYPPHYQLICLNNYIITYEITLNKDIIFFAFFSNINKHKLTFEIKITFDRVFINDFRERDYSTEIQKFQSYFNLIYPELIITEQHVLNTFLI